MSIVECETNALLEVIQMVSHITCDGNMWCLKVTHKRYLIPFSLGLEVSPNLVL
jgi:hypothetical protein